MRIHEVRRRPRFERRIVRAQRCGMAVEDPLGHRFAALESRRLQHRRDRHLLLHLRRLLLVPRDPAEVDDPHVARLQLHFLRAHGAFEVGDGDHVARTAIERPTLRGAIAGDVEHHCASGDAAPRPVIDAEPRFVVAFAQLFVPHAAPEAVLEVTDVRESVPLARRLREEVVEAVVAVVAHRNLAEDGVAELAAAEQRRIRLLLLPVHRKHGALAHQLARRRRRCRASAG